MAEEDINDAPPAPKSKVPLIVGGFVGLIAILAIIMVMLGDSEPGVIVEAPPGEYLVNDKMYQLKDGSYLKLSFSIVVDSNKVEDVRVIIEEQAPGRLPDGVNMIVGNKAREDLINGTHKREAFARELKKMLEERVFADYNRRQESSLEAIEVKEVLISDFVTQPG